MVKTKMGEGGDGEREGRITVQGGRRDRVQDERWKQGEKNRDGDSWEDGNKGKIMCSKLTRK